MRVVVALMSAVAVGGIVAWAFGTIGPIARPRRRRDRSVWLRQAGVSTSPGRFWMASTGAAGVAGMGVSLVTGSWIVALFPALLVGTLPRLYYASHRRKRMAELRQAWPDGLRDLLASISAGRSLTRALEDLAESGPAPLRNAFSSFPFGARSLGTAAALEAVRDTMADPTTDRVVEVLVVAHERGGSIVIEILRDLAEATARDVWAAEETDSLSLEHKINARVVFVLPWAVLVAMTARDGPFREFYGTPLGVAVILLGGVLSVTGAIVASRLGRQPDEPRVLGVRE